MCCALIVSVLQPSSPRLLALQCTLLLSSRFLPRKTTFFRSTVDDIF
jgi:hypothetical protein